MTLEFFKSLSGGPLDTENSYIFGQIYKTKQQIIVSSGPSFIEMLIIHLTQVHLQVFCVGPL